MEIITEELLEKGLIFRDPEKIATGKPYIEIVDKAEYLCGDVRRNLVMAESAASQDSKYAKNAEALREVIPEDIGAAEIESSKNDPSNEKKVYENAKKNGLKVTTQKGAVISDKAQINCILRIRFG